MKYLITILACFVICVLIAADAKKWNDAARKSGYEPEGDES